MRDLAAQQFWVPRMSKMKARGVIRADEAYSKAELFQRLVISQNFWDQMLNNGLPFSQVGKSRWVRGQDLLDYFSRIAQQKQSANDEP